MPFWLSTDDIVYDAFFSLHKDRQELNFRGPQNDFYTFNLGSTKISHETCKFWEFNLLWSEAGITICRRVIQMK